MPFLPKKALNKNLCNQCNINYYPIENDVLNFEEYFKCYRNPKGFYLDKNELIYKKCYYSCDTCEIQGNNITHNCIKCKANFSVEISYNNYINCYEENEYYHSFDSEMNIHSTIDLSCPEGYLRLKNNIKECIKYDIKDMILKIPKYEKNDTDNKSKEEEVKYYDEVLDNIELGFTSEYYDTSNLDSGKEEIIETEKMKITLTTTQNQINNTKDNMTSIFLGYCETLLRRFYNISNDKILYMKKIDVIQEGLKIPKVEFDIYCKLSGNNLIKLNKSICENSKIFLSVPVNISEDIYKLNTSGGYYNNKCLKATSDSGTDIVLKDRQKEFIEGNKTVCQDDCDFSEYNHNTGKANCSCKVKESSSSVINMTISKEKLYENFAYINNKKEISNLGRASCNVLSSKENIISNTAFFILLIILAIFVIIFIIFCRNGYHSLENKINQVIYKKFRNDDKKEIGNLGITSCNVLSST